MSEQQRPVSLAVGLRILVTAAVSCALTGCYPALKVVRPAVDLSVVEPDGRAVEDATVTLATYRFPFPMARSTTLAAFRTDADGALHVRKRRKWLIQVALPDGVHWYRWGYCIEKPGYRAVAAAEAIFDEPLTVVLERTDRQSACEWPADDELYRELEVVER